MKGGVQIEQDFSIAFIHEIKQLQWPLLVYDKPVCDSPWSIREFSPERRWYAQPSHRMGKWPLMKTEMLLSLVRVGASGQLDPSEGSKTTQILPFAPRALFTFSSLRQMSCSRSLTALTSQPPLLIRCNQSWEGFFQLPYHFTISELRCFTINQPFSLICLSKPQPFTLALSFCVSFLCPSSGNYFAALPDTAGILCHFSFPISDLKKFNIQNKIANSIPEARKTNST